MFIAPLVLMPESRTLGDGLLDPYTALNWHVQVLDAPALQDDFYLNLVDWSSQNTLAVGLGSCVYLWSACTSKVQTDFAHDQKISCIPCTEHPDGLSHYSAVASAVEAGNCRLSLSLAFTLALHEIHQPASLSCVWPASKAAQSFHQ